MGQRPGTRQAYQNERRVLKKGYVRREEDRGATRRKIGGKRQFAGDAGVKGSQRGHALGGHGTRYAVRRPPSWEQDKRMLTVVDHIIL